MINVEIWEWFLAPLYILVSVPFIWKLSNSNTRKYLITGVAARIVGAFSFFLIYVFYYNGGDTVAYYTTAVSITNLFSEDFTKALEVLFSGFSEERYSYFSSTTGFPHAYIMQDPSTFMVSKIIVPILLISMKSYLLATLLIAQLSIIGPWYLFKFLRTITNGNSRIAAISVLLFPSVLFWGCGISKDTITYSSLCFLIYTIHQILSKNSVNFFTATFASISAYFILIIKPYIFIAVVPSLLLWVFSSRIKKIRNKFIRISITPATILLSILLFSYVFVAISPYLGDYSVDKIIDKALITQEDLTRDVYGENSFNIGTIEPTFFGILSKFPIATFYGFFGPTLLHVNNIVMLFSALENTFLLLLTMRIFVFRNPMNTFQRIEASPFLTFCFTFAILLGFSIGLSTPNFGALVRFKIPMIPFFVFMLLSISYKIDLKEK
ncbi:MAG: hypothetical protein R2813_02620 [Flavobacteriales bacterium]